MLMRLQQEAEEVRGQVAALKHESQGLAERVEPAVAALLAANPPYQPPPQEDKVPPAAMNITSVSCLERWQWFG